MSLPLLKAFTKNSWKLWLIFVGILLMYMSILVFAFDQMKDMMEGATTQELMGIPFDLSSRFSLLAGTYFDMIIFMFPMVFYIILANKLVSKTVDDTSMSAFLSSSLSRKKYITTAAVFLTLSLTAMFLIVFVAGGLLLLCFETVNWLNLANMVLTTLTCTLAIAAVSFFFSSVMAANKTGNILLIGLPIAFVMFMWLGEMPALDFLLYLTPIGYVDTVLIGQGTESLWWLINLVFVTVTVALFIISIKVFDKKQLSV